MALSSGTGTPTGTLGLQVVRRPPTNRELSRAEMMWWGRPRRDTSREVSEWRRQNTRNLWRGARRVLAARALKLPRLYGALFLELRRGDGEVIDLGLASLRVVTTVGVKYICDDIAGGASDSNLFKFHGFGTGATAEAVGDTALVTELTTQYNPDNTRPTGSQASATVSTNATYTTVATLSPDTGGTIAVAEHGIFSQAATGGGTLLDRSVFSAVNLVAASDSLQATYVYTLNAGS
jgi:hypothetical protein